MNVADFEWWVCIGDTAVSATNGGIASSSSVSLVMERRHRSALDNASIFP